MLNGGDGEGGGQLLRVATALSAVTHNVVRVHSIRANRTVPGLHNHHLSTIELVAALSTGGVLTGAKLSSTDLTLTHALLFWPRVTEVVSSTPPRTHVAAFPL